MVHFECGFLSWTLLPASCSVKWQSRRRSYWQCYDWIKIEKQLLKSNSFIQCISKVVFCNSHVWLFNDAFNDFKMLYFSYQTPDQTLVWWSTWLVILHVRQIFQFSHWCRAREHIPVKWVGWQHLLPQSFHKLCKDKNVSRPITVHQTRSAVAPPTEFCGVSLTDETNSSRAGTQEQKTIKYIMK